jgi:sec-independent protein translocase protein TatC
VSRVGRLAGRRGEDTAHSPDGRMELIEHIRELRNRLEISLLALAMCVVVAFFLRDAVFDVLKGPVLRDRGR